MIMTTFFIATEKYLIQHKTLIVHCQWRDVSPCLWQVRESARSARAWSIMTQNGHTATGKKTQSSNDTRWHPKLKLIINNHCLNPRTSRTLWLADIQTSDLCLWQKEEGHRIQSKLSSSHSRWGMLVVDVWSKMALVRGPGRLQELIRLDCGVIGDSLPRNEEHTPTLRSTNITDITTTIHSTVHTTPMLPQRWFCLENEF